MTGIMEFHKDRLEQLSELAQIGWWEADLKGECYLCSAFICNLLGLKKSSIRFSEFKRLIHPDFRDNYVQEARNLKPGQVFDQIIPLCISGQEVWVNLRACIRHYKRETIFGTLQVVEAPCTGRGSSLPRVNGELVESMNKELADSEELFRNIFNYIPIGEELYTEDGILYDINPKAMEIFGVGSKDDVRGVDMFQNPNIPDDVKEAVRKREVVEFTRSFYPGKVRESNYYEFADKGQMELYTKIAPLYNYSGTFSGLYMY